MVNEELEARKSGKHRRVSLFLVDSVTLVFQQASVLDNNLDAKVGMYYGDMCDKDKMWKPEVWDKVLSEDMVIIMTADVLYLLLCRAFVRMKDINLLCFDEAHHAKKNHVYARIIKDFYETELEEARPRIFGMTASPVDARVDVVEAAMELERLLHSRIMTADDLSLTKQAVKRPNERVMPFPQLKRPWETPLCLELRKKYGDLGVLKKTLIFAKEATSELGKISFHEKQDELSAYLFSGPWCADHIWQSALSESSAYKLQRKSERISGKSVYGKSIEELDKEIAQIQEAQEYVSTLEFDPPKFTEEDCSIKVLVLRKALQSIYKTSDVEKCIVFVKKRYTAKCLFEILKENVSDKFRVGILIGSRAGGMGDDNFTLRQQMLNVHRFRNGKLNCLIATSVAEEGLDVPDCNWVIRFDLYSTMIQYIQSRGRARHIQSRYFHMVEQGNKEQLTLIREVFKAEETMRLFCRSLPEDRKLNEREPYNPNDEQEPYYLEEETGAKLTFTSAMQVVTTYTSNLVNLASLTYFSNLLITF
jgi:endoribonuclease Dicer